MGPGWELAKVRGTRFNTGDASRWPSTPTPCRPATGPAATRWRGIARAEFGDLSVGDNFQKHNYPFSLMINANGERFVDEGRISATTLRQVRPRDSDAAGQFCWQVFDKKCCTCCATKYRIKRITKVSATLCPSWCEKLDGVQRDQGAGDIKAFNQREAGGAFNPNIKTVAARWDWQCRSPTGRHHRGAAVRGLCLTAASLHLRGVKIDTSAA